MKKQITIFLSLIFVLGLVPVNLARAEDVIYSNSENHYSFSIPDGWEEMPKSTIDELNSRATQQISEPFIAGFKIKGSIDFQVPYILVSKFKTKLSSYTQLRKEIPGAKFSQNINENVNDYSNLIANATLEKPYIDEKRNVVFINEETDIAGVGQVKGLTASFLGKYDTAQINFSTTKTEYLKDLPIFIQIISSFKYENEYAYDEIESKKNDPEEVSKNALAKGSQGIVAAVVLILIIAIFSIFKKIIKKKENNRRSP